MTLSELSQKSFVENCSICIVGSWEPRIRLPSVTRLRYVRDSFGITKLPRSIAAQYFRCLNFLAFDEPRIFKFFITISAVSLTLSRAVVHIFFVDSFQGEIDHIRWCLVKYIDWNALSSEYHQLQNYSPSFPSQMGFQCRPILKSFYPHKGSFFWFWLRQMIPMTAEVCNWVTNACLLSIVGFLMQIHSILCSLWIKPLLLLSNIITNITLFWWRGMPTQFHCKLISIQKRRD